MLVEATELLEATEDEGEATDELVAVVLALVETVAEADEVIGTGEPLEAPVCWELVTMVALVPWSPRAELDVGELASDAEQ